MEQRDVPFSSLLRVLERAGYTLVRIVGPFRYFDPPPSARGSARRIGFPVENKMVRYKYVQRILKAIDEDAAGKK